jgi:hypothetical protein
MEKLASDWTKMRGKAPAHLSVRLLRSSLHVEENNNGSMYNK